MTGATHFGFTTPPKYRFDPERGRTARVSLAWWSTGPDDRTPTFTGSAESPRTVVVVWSTDSTGRLLREEIDGWQALEWVMSAAVFSELAELHRDFHLGAHDVLVTGGPSVRVAPCRESVLRLAGDQNPELRNRVLAAVGAIERRARLAG